MTTRPIRIWSLIFSFSFIQAAFAVAESPKFQQDSLSICQIYMNREAKLESSSNAGFPFIAYTPETKLLGGIAGMYYFRDKTDSTFFRPSSFTGGISYSQRKQLSLITNFDVYFNHGKYRLFGRLSYEKYPFFFYGIGRNSLESDKEKYSPETYELHLNFLNMFQKLPVGQGWNFGLTYHFRLDHLLKLERNGQLNNLSVKGINGGIVSGFGFTLNRDARNNVFSTACGSFYELTATFHTKFIGSDYTFNRYTFDARRYYAFAKDHIIAFQTYFSFIAGNPPFYLLSLLGGDQLLRGYFLGRFRDNHLAVCQAEYRFPLWWHFGLAVFGGVGEVSHRVKTFQLSEVQYGGGVGLRYFLKPDERLAIRADLGFGENSTQLYLTLLEAF
ncbi:Outer membrane protein/protective antigen OMA87-like protein [Chloroherpeton thalassium ATCC 35110]|uniref:Outer membrane protein/protective antigen OMA87-like protein n=1 Tax=Chloroherpeton thalassium (strain ATCC 35110 / GB-78) TaxID=517418 RepID=B3QVH2_CHLT3|nr:BamA/TamA family outer membrane protein [Chloroherpeton thalassium]ACF14572.1 Outer membrane protein/protective antigen OMA87-like protein [Chloroherpeton thalassium ATCC 35110]